MAEDLGSIMGRGFELWRKNLILSVPFLLNEIAQFLVLIAFGVVSVIILLILSPSLDLTYILSSIGGASMLILAILGIILFLALVVLLGVVSAFFTSGAIGMCKEAVKTGSTKFSQMMDYGRKKAISLFIANIILGIIIFLGTIILGGFFIGFPLLLQSLLGGGLELFFIILLILGAGVLILFLITVSVIFAPMPFAIIVSDLGAVDGIKRSFDFFKKNKLHTFLLWLVILFISIGISILFAIMRLPFNLVDLGIIGIVMGMILNLINVLIAILVISPVTTVWWTLFYISRTRVSE